MKSFRQHERSEKRQLDLYSLSAGAYEEEDIQLVYEAQKGRCYYTGEPLIKSPKNFQIDHIIPIVKNGSSRPYNLALVLKEANQEKSNLTKKSYFDKLRKRNGEAWFKNQILYCKSVDDQRKKIDRYRRKKVKESVLLMEKNLQQAFPNRQVYYKFDNEVLTLKVAFIDVLFPLGFIRLKNKYNSEKYLIGIIKTLLQ